MATTSSSEDSLAPKDFHLSTSTDSGSRLSPNRQRCPLCRKFKKVFYCQDCFHSGVFYSSRDNLTEGFLDKQRNLLELEDRKRTLEQKCLILLEEKEKALDLLNIHIRQAKDRIKILKSAIEEKKSKRIPNQTKLAALKDKNDRSNKSLLKYDKKIQEYETGVMVKNDKIERIRQTVREKQKELRKLVLLRLKELSRFIFPITAVRPSLNKKDHSALINELAEAQRTICISNRWEYSDYVDELKYCIVGPTLPESGNYSAYNYWVSQRQHESNNGSTSQINPVHSISAALMYTAQFVEILSFYLNVNLPFKMQYSDFCDMSVEQFARRTARLNANILYLCFLHSVNLSKLKACKTICNLLELLADPYNLKRKAAEFDVEKANALEEEASKDLNTINDSDIEEGDSFPTEWEAVPLVPCPEVEAGAVISQTSQMSSTQQTSMAGGLVNSAAASIVSMWRGIIGR